MSLSVESPILIIFDVDGTLVDAETLDHASFNHAIREITGILMTDTMWSGFEEVTSQATIHQAFGKGRHEDLSLIKDRVKDAFLAKLHLGHGQDANAIRAFSGAVDLFSGLKKSPQVGVAIATGCWRETAHYKLKAAGFDLSDIPFACASDCYTRAEIISLAAERAGMPLEQAVYVGDGLWDLRATRQLGIPFIGVGRKVETLRRAGAEHTMEVFSPETLSQVVRQLRPLRVTNGTIKNSSS